MTLARGSGILLHPTSLPGPFGSGDLGESLEHFLTWMEHAGQRYWQVLPLHPTGYGHSPYSALSAFASNPMLIDLTDLQRRGLLEPRDIDPLVDAPPRRIDFGRVNAWRWQRLRKAAQRFFQSAPARERARFDGWREAHARWLPDYSLFMALNEHFHGREWSQWDAELAGRDEHALAQARSRLSDQVALHDFTQWVFAEQWARLRERCRERRIQIIGDAPIFVAYHSADVWARQDVFVLDERGRPTVVAGVPPDYFSETGQRWGNPLYRWDRLAHDGYGWWVERLRSVLESVDIVRLDHFRGFAAYWEIPASEPTAINGQWMPGPGAALFEAVGEALGRLPIVAEDLGVVTPDVTLLRDQFDFPGMKVLQFAFGSGPANPFLPHNYIANSVVYTGTHDNDTTRGWWMQAPGHEQLYARRYLGHDAHEINWDLIRLASQSSANLSIFPFQDVLGLGSEGRMNRPGQAEGNWDWRYEWEEMPPDATARLRDITETYGRLP